MSTTPDATRTLTGSLTAVQTATQTVGPKQLADADGDAYERRIDSSDLPEDYQEALNADSFILFGKASIQQYDKGNPREGQPRQKLDMGALSEALPEYLDADTSAGNISFGHQDVEVGRAIDSYTLNEPTEIEVDGDTHEFDAGDTLETHVDEDAGEFWIVADLFNEKYFHRKTRLLTLAGALDGFSVTVVAREWEETDAGQYVTALDWHSTTIGTGDQILNPGSEFGVAEFKAALRGGVASGVGGVSGADGASPLPTDAGDAGGAGDTSGTTVVQEATDDATIAEDFLTAAQHATTTDTDTNTTRGTTTMALLDGLFGGIGAKADFARALDTASTKREEQDISRKEAVSVTFDEAGDDEFKGVDPAAVRNAMDDSDKATDASTDEGEDEADAAGGGDADPEVDPHADTGDMIAALAAERDVSEEEIRAALNQMGEGDDGEEEEEMPPGPDEEEEEDDEDDVSGKGDDPAVPENVVTEDDLDAKLDDLRQDLVDDAAEETAEKLAPVLEDTVEEGIEEIGEKMHTGGTGDPAGGPAETGFDLDSELERMSEDAPARVD